MKTQVIAGHTVLSVRWKSETGVSDIVNVVKLGRRVRVTTNDLFYIKECLTGAPARWGSSHYKVDDIQKNIEIGPKALARVFDDALIYGHSKSRNVDSDYAFESDKLAVERAGAKRVRFTAPCGEEGYLTNTEATKLVAALRAL